MASNVSQSQSIICPVLLKDQDNLRHMALHSGLGLSLFKLTGFYAMMKIHLQVLHSVQDLV